MNRADKEERGWAAPFLFARLKQAPRRLIGSLDLVRGDIPLFRDLGPAEFGDRDHLPCLLRRLLNQGGVKKRLSRPEPLGMNDKGDVVHRQHKGFPLPRPDPVHAMIQIRLQLLSRPR